MQSCAESRSKRFLSLVAPVVGLLVAGGCGYIGYEIYDPPTDNPCWSRIGGDTCSDPVPPADRCLAGLEPLIFTDDLDGSPDGVLFTSFRQGEGAPEPCASLYVGGTGYFRIYTSAFAGSGPSQLDESGYVTVHNNCNSDGWPAERNAAERYVVRDSDNLTGTPQVFIGTFLLVEGERNRICFHHWCQYWHAELLAGRDLGFVMGDCRDGNSIGFTATGSVGCADRTTLHRCSWGCVEGRCLADPCDSLSCPSFCMDGACLDTNPCDQVACAHGCVRGRCLQGPNARGPDADLDGYSDLADCDDGDRLANPGLPEVCATGADENCDGHVDEPGCVP